MCKVCAGKRSTKYSGCQSYSIRRSQLHPVPHPEKINCAVGRVQDFNPIQSSEEVARQLSSTCELAFCEGPCMLVTASSNKEPDSCVKLSVLASSLLASASMFCVAGLFADRSNESGMHTTVHLRGSTERCDKSEDLSRSLGVRSDLFLFRKVQCETRKAKSIHHPRAL